MEITLNTRNGIAANPTIEFLELCQLCVDVCNNVPFANILLPHKLNELSRPDTYIAFEQFNRFGLLIFEIAYQMKGTGTLHRFATHEQISPAVYELCPNITERKFNE
jgi:hypothetical protein